MRISVFGLGYVGSVSAACFAADGHSVVGVDPNETKVALVNDGKAPVVEKDLGEMMETMVAAGRLKATQDPSAAVMETDLSMICVGTPSQPNGSLDVGHVMSVCREIGAALAAKRGYHVVVVRSTVLPGTVRDSALPVIEESSGKQAGRDFGFANNPEFLRESTAIYDFHNPPKTVIGEIDKRAGDAVERLYQSVDAPMIRTSIEVAEMVKYADNAWHGLKVAFANEVGNVCKKLSIDSHQVMDIFCRDTKLNLSPYYLKPGFAFGGSCLPKDLRALMYKARSLDLELPVIGSVLPSNNIQVERGVNMIIEKGRKRVGFLGFSFKAGTDDLRESPQVEVIERLIGKGYDLKLYDRNVNLAKLMGANKDYIQKAIPHISRLMVDSVDEVLAHGEVIVVGNGDQAFADVPQRLNQDQFLIDMVRVADMGVLNGQYDGINW